MPSVSVIVPVYNVEKYLERCLDSLASQTLQDIEVILVNDGSTDGSEDILQKYVDKYPGKFKKFNKTNGGLSDARNFGMKFATGKYIAFLDSDDYVENTTYAEMFEKASLEDLDYVECDFIWEYPNKIKKDVGKEFTNQKQMMKYGRVVAWNKIIKREIVEKANIHFTKGVRYEDVDFFYNMIPMYNKTGTVRKPLIHYTQRPSSISNVQDERNKDIFVVLGNVIEHYKQNKLLDEFHEELEYTVARILFCSSLFRIVKIQDKNVREQLEEKTYEFVYTNFPNWKENPILKKEKGLKNLYLKTINKQTFKIYCKMFRALNGGKRN